MEPLQLYKFIHDNDIEYHRYDSEGVVMTFIPFRDLSDFCKMCSYCLFDDGGVKVALKDDCIALDMQPICDYYGINVTDIFPLKDNR